MKILTPLPLVALLAAVPVATAKPAPCSAHTRYTTPTKQECVRQWKRDRLTWPPNPTKREIIRRIGAQQYAKALRVAYCETAGNLRHYPYSTYRGMMGMYVHTYNYGARVTSYPQPDTATEQQQVAIAIAAFPITGGWSGWSCGNA